MFVRVGLHSWNPILLSMTVQNSKEGFHPRCPNCEILKMENTKLAQILSEQKATNEEVRAEADDNNTGEISPSDGPALHQLCLFSGSQATARPLPDSDH